MERIEEDYCDFEIAKLLKEKGFKGQRENFYENNEIVHCINYWDRITPKQRYEAIEAPTIQMAMKWLREMHNIHIELNWDKGNQLYSFQIWKPGKFQPEISSLDLWRIYKDDNYLGEWNYEKAAEEAIKYCLENLI